MLVLCIVEHNKYTAYLYVYIYIVYRNQLRMTYAVRLRVKNTQVKIINNIIANTIHS